jgi:hypothetical protein
VAGEPRGLSELSLDLGCGLLEHLDVVAKERRLDAFVDQRTANEMPLDQGTSCSIRMMPDPNQSRDGVTILTACSASVGDKRVTQPLGAPRSARTI